MFVLIDNYDSFTYNLLHFMGEEGADMRVFRNDAISPEDVITMKPAGIVLSPGPCDPDKAGICLDLIAKTQGTIPIMGVCLGHQSIGQAFGGRVVPATRIMHGKTDQITHKGTDIFEGIPSPFTATRYHSLTVAADSIPECLNVTATSDDGTVMGLAHTTFPVFGVQFHPESIASEHGHQLLRNFIDISTGKKDRKAA